MGSEEILGLSWEEVYPDFNGGAGLQGQAGGVPMLRQDLCRVAIGKDMARRLAKSSRSITGLSVSEARNSE